MKKFYFILTAAASIALASCTNDEIVGQGPGTNKPSTDGVIAFGGLAPAMTRADLYGSAAATKLGNKFVVYGTKHAAAEEKTAANDAVVFNNFQVEYSASTAGTTPSNSSDWEYVGKQAYNSTPSSQGIKYWDYSAAQGYTFYAFSSSNISYPANGSDLVSVTKVTTDGTTLYNKGYQVTVKDGANLDNLYFSDRVEVPKGNYDKTVDFTFRNIGTKVRVGFYETIPGYSVTIDKFYIDEDADPDAVTPTAPVTSFDAMVDPKTDGFYAAFQNVKRGTGVNQTLNVTYNPAPSTATAIVNRPKVSNPSAGYDYALKLGTAAGIIGTALSTSSASPTWVDGSAAGNYTTVFPFEGNSNPMLLKLDFTLTADDGSGDVIKVKNARAVVPAQYVQWKNNFAYTYIFKISNNSNGTTGVVGTDPEGLKAITFDAIVVDVTEERQETVTSVSTNTITTYAKGEITDEYTTGEPIYVSISNTTSGAVITPSSTGASDGQAQIYKLDKAVTEAEVLAQKTGSPMGITFTEQSTTLGTTVPLTDGTTPSISNVSFTPSTAGTYAYIYTTTAYVAPTYTAQPSGTYDSSETYYMLSGSGAYYTVTVPDEAAFEANKANLYVITTAGTPGVYDVKVIKVQ